ncbi:MAG: hypothetical protein Q7S40_27265 [Opitutaceae bacterium]|nr:hypothetical protein [Opitutaceae bacterium]
MTNPSASNLPAQHVCWSDVARACRRVCLLREQGDSDEAERLRSGPLADMIAALRTPADTEASLAQRLESIFAAETERVATAVVIAELLAPMLRPMSFSSAAPLSPAHAATRIVASNAPFTHPGRSGAADIADFIDEMIAQENAIDGPHRRAS